MLKRAYDLQPGDRILQDGTSYTITQANTGTQRAGYVAHQTAEFPHRIAFRKGERVQVLTDSPPSS